MMPANEYYPCFPDCARLAPSALPFFEANMSRAAEAAGDKLSVYRETPVIKLLKDNDRVVGVVAQDESMFSPAVRKLCSVTSWGGRPCGFWPRSRYSRHTSSAVAVTPMERV